MLSVCIQLLVYTQVQSEYRQLRMRVGMGVRVEMRVIVIVRVGR